MEFKKIFSLKSTWLGRKGTLTIYQLNTRRDGPRVTVRWFEDGTVEVKGIKGDGRTPSFEELYAVTLTRPFAHTVEREMRNAYNALLS